MASLARYYRTLGVPLTASAKEIRAAYIELCKKCHPDVLKSSNSNEVEANKVKFQEIQDAYAQLINKDGSKNENLASSSAYSTSPSAAYENAARQATGFPGSYEAYREEGYYRENPYIHRQYRRRPNPKGNFDFEAFYRKKYGQSYEDYKKWSSNTSSEKEEYDEEFWRQREWNEYKKMMHRRKILFRERAEQQIRLAMVCIIIFMASNLVFYTFADPVKQSPQRNKWFYW